MPQVVIVGRANVGKSTLFNRLIEKNKALVSAVSGTTRDRNIDVVEWRDKTFTLIDTGGLDIDKTIENKIATGIIKQAEKGISQADLILFLIDIKTGLLVTDKQLARQLIKRKLKPKIILVANKADSLKWRSRAAELYQLGLGEPQLVSAITGSGVGDLLDVIVEKLPAQPQLSASARQPRRDGPVTNYPPRLASLGETGQLPIKVAIVGKPNVGKSSLLNSILGEERVIVTDIPHTTRESHDTAFIYKDKNFILIDTAGLRKRGKITPHSLEKKSVEKSSRTITGADVVLLVTEAQKTIDSQDKKITQEILAAGKSLIIVVNKWDLIPNKDTNTINRFVKYYQGQLPYLWWAPLIFISALEDQRTKKILDLILDIEESKNIEISNSQLARFLKSKIKQHRPSRGQGLKNPYIYSIEQAGKNPPRFYIYVNDPKILHFSYIRFLQNNLREQFKIIGTPIQVEVRKWEKENK